MEAVVSMPAMSLHKKLFDTPSLLVAIITGALFEVALLELLVQDRCTLTFQVDGIKNRQGSVMIRLESVVASVLRLAIPRESVLHGPLGFADVHLALVLCIITLLKPYAQCVPPQAMFHSYARVRLQIDEQ